MTSMLLLVLGAVILLVCVVSCVILLRSGNNDSALAARIEQVTATTRQHRTVATPSITRKEATANDGWRESVAQTLGFSFEQRDQYSVAWYWVVAAGMLAGRVAVLFASGLLGVYAWGLFPVVAVLLSQSFFGNMKIKRVALLRAQFPDALGLIVRAVRVGVPVTEALRAVCRESLAPTRGEFERLVNEIAIGAPLETALRQLADRNDLPEYGFFASALSLQATTGGGLSETLELLADVTRKRVAMKARGHALSAEARTSSMILAGLPVVSGGMLYAINPEYMGTLFSNDTGRMILGAALLSLCTGVFVMRMIIRKSLS